MNKWPRLKVVLFATIMLALVSNIHPIRIVDSSVPSQEQANASPFLSVNDSDGSLFLNGTEFHAVGANHADLIWSFINESYVQGQDNGTRVIEEAAKHGIRVLRFPVIGCGANAHPFIELWHNLNTRAMFWTRFANMVGYASSCGVYLVPSLVWTMSDFEPFSYIANYNGNSDYKPSPEQIQRLFVNGSNENTVLSDFIDDMVTNQSYGDNSTILMWEIGNELDLTCNNPVSPENGNFTTIPILRNFLNETANYIHSLDRNHLVESGLQKVPHGYPDQNLSNATSAFVDFYRGINVNVTSLHVYKNNDEKLYGPPYGVSNRTYITSFLDASRNNLKKPLIIGEFGEPGTTATPDDSSFILSVLETTLRYKVPLSMVWEWMVPSGWWLGILDRGRFNISPESTLNTTSTPNLVNKLEIYSRLVSATNNTFNVVHNGEALDVLVHSNSTIKDFNYSEALGQIAFNVTGPTASVGFCRVTIPNPIFQDVLHGNCTVLLDGVALNETKNWTVQDFNETFIYFIYEHSEHRITIVPEFPSFFVLTPFLTAILLAFTIYKRKRTR